MSGEIRVAIKVLGAVLLIDLALFCGYGFLASYELGFPNVFHAIYGVAGLAAMMGAICLLFPAFKPISTGKADSQWASYCRPWRLAALSSLFSVLAFMTGDFTYLWFLLFLLFLLPIPAKPRTQP
jgi:hypothetical protein